MHEHYEDCPWREQALYANDSRNQALTGYYAFGEYDFPAVSFELLGRSAGDDGYMTLCAPMDSPFTIPSFTMVWFLALADHLNKDGKYACLYFNMEVGQAARENVAQGMNSILRELASRAETYLNDKFPQTIIKRLLEGQSYGIALNLCPI